MEVRFRTNKLRQQYEKSAKAVRAYGQQVAEKYIERINILKSARNKSDLANQGPLKFHELKGERKGQYSIRLHDRWRLIVTFYSEEAEIVQIEEVSKHYGD